MRLILALALAVILTGCNIVITGEKFTLHTSIDNIPARVEIEDFTMTIPVSTVYMPEPKHRNTSIEVVMY